MYIYIYIYIICYNIFWSIQNVREITLNLNLYFNFKLYNIIIHV